MSNYLIDTQILIWTIIEPKRLSNNTILQEHTISVSQISIFEIAIKQKIGKLSALNISIEELLKRIELDNFQILPIKNEHIANYSQIPLLPDHRDPFDRLILATALSENMPLISADEKFTNYQYLIQLITNS